VKALIPTDHRATGKLWRTKAVVGATTDRNVPPKTIPDAKAAMGVLEMAGMTVATLSRQQKGVSAPPPRARCKLPAQSLLDIIVASPNTRQNAVTTELLIPALRSNAMTNVM